MKFFQKIFQGGFLLLLTTGLLGCSGLFPNDTTPTPSSLSPSPTKSPSDSVIIFDANQTIEQYTITANINNVIIKKGVTVKGSFKIEERTEPLTIEGEGETSVLEGIEGTRNYGIEADCNFTINLKNFKSLNPSYYHMRLTKNKIVAEGMYLVDDSGDTQKNADGFSGGDGSVYNNCYVNTWDDSFKIYYGSYTIKNTKIVHNGNGAPFQLGWGDKINDECTLILDNVTVVSNDVKDYNQGVFSWAGGVKAQKRNIKLEGKGLIRETNPGMEVAPLYQFGSNPNSTANKTINISGVDASSFASTEENTVSKNSSINNQVNVQ